MKNVIKPQSYSVDAFEILKYFVQFWTECGKGFHSTETTGEIDPNFSDEAIKFSYLYHSNLRDWSVRSVCRAGERDPKRCKLCYVHRKVFVVFVCFQMIFCAILFGLCVNFISQRIYFAHVDTEKSLNKEKDFLWQIAAYFHCLYLHFRFTHVLSSMTKNVNLSVRKLLFAFKR